jgi:hypothetical protein
MSYHAEIKTYDHCADDLFAPTDRHADAARPSPPVSDLPLSVHFFAEKLTLSPMFCTYFSGIMYKIGLSAWR